jgi:hypothetical protein
MRELAQQKRWQKVISCRLSCPPLLHVNVGDAGYGDHIKTCGSIDTSGRWDKSKHIMALR